MNVMIKVKVKLVADDGLDNDFWPNWWNVDILKIILKIRWLTDDNYGKWCLYLNIMKIVKFLL